MTVHTGRHFLQIPGPTNVPDRVLRAMDMPTMDHRGPEFAEVGHAVLAAMQRVFRTKQPVIIYPSSGTGAWEAALVNTLQPGDKVLMAETGQFAVLWRGIAEKFKLESISCPVTGVTAPTSSRSRRGCRPTRRTRSRPCAWFTTRPRPAASPIRRKSVKFSTASIIPRC